MILDYDEEGNLVSLEIMDASRRVTETRKIEFQTTGTPVYVVRDGKIVDLTAENRLKKAQESGQGKV